MTPLGLAPVRAQLENGVVILAKRSRVTPAVTIHATVKAGSVCDPPGQEGLAHYVSRVIDRGSEGRSADQVADALDSRGVSLVPGISRHGLSLVCTCLEEDLEAVLAVLADVIIRPTFPSGEVETRRGEILTLIRQGEDSPASVASETLVALLYGDTHSYGRRLRGTMETVHQVERAALAAFHRAHFAPAAVSFAMVGDVETQRAIGAATAVFGGWSAEAVTLPECPVVPAAETRRVRVVPMMNKSQADVAYGFTAVDRAHTDYYAYWLMNNILGQYALGGRLGDSIRERQGMAYYASSAFDPDPVQSSLIVRAGVHPDNVPRAVASIDAELTRMASDGPTDAELQESKRYLVGAMPRNLETNLGIATFLQSIEFFGLGLDYDVRLPGLLAEVTRDAVHDAARTLLNPSKAAVVAAGPFAGPLE